MTTFVRAPEVLWRRTFDRVLALVPGSDELVTLTGTGVDLWDALAVPQSLGQVATGLAGRFDATPAQVEHDIEPALAQLTARRLVRRADP